MLTLIFYVAIVYIMIRMFIWGLKAAWGIARILAFVVLLPVILVGLALSGLFMIAFGLMVLMVIFSTIGALVWV